MSGKNNFTMTQEDADLVLKAIQWWEGDVDAERCPLCAKYKRWCPDLCMNECKKCPVVDYTGQSNCAATPFFLNVSHKSLVQLIIAYGYRMLAEAGYEVEDADQ